MITLLNCTFEFEYEKCDSKKQLCIRRFQISYLIYTCYTLLFLVRNSTLLVFFFYMSCSTRRFFLLQKLQSFAWTKRLVEEFCLQYIRRNAQLLITDRPLAVGITYDTDFLKIFLKTTSYHLNNFCCKKNGHFIIFSTNVCVCRTILFMHP